MSTVRPQDLGEIDRSSETPIYRQIAERLRSLISDGVLVSGDLLPSGPELSRYFGVAPMTVREAINLLRNEGLAIAEKGKGVYVNAPPPLRTALRTINLPLELPSLLGRMPPIPMKIGDAGDGSVLTGRVDTVTSGSMDAVRGVIARVLLEVAHGADSLGAYAISTYAINWREPFDDQAIVVDEAIGHLRTQIAEVVELRESLSSRMPTAQEVRLMSIPRDQPVTTVAHVGTLRSGETVSAETVRDGRIPVRVT